VEFYIPPSAHLTKTTDADYVEYHVRYGPTFEKVRLNFMFGPMVGGYSPHDAQGRTIRWTSRKWQCNGIEDSDVRGLSADGRRWRYINILASGFAAYEASPQRLRTTFMESWTRCAAESCHFDGWLARSMMIIFLC
jgi:hypothetical protein